LKKIYHIIFFLTLIAIFSSCLKNEICSPLNIELKAGIYTIPESEGVFDTIPKEMDFDSIYALSMEDENLLLNASQINEISFPLNNLSNESSFVLCSGETKDTISFIYEKHLLFNSVKCGFTYTYTITDLKFSTHLLQNIILTNPEIDVISAENILLVY